jgi:hypothetical protein
LTPRALRTQELVRSLERDWDVNLIALPERPPAADARPATGKKLWRKLGGRTVRTVLLDRWEPWSAATFRGWTPDADAGLLVAFPWSPVVRAAARMRAAGVPYVIDAGDPWIITIPELAADQSAAWRARRLEPVLWRGAAGAVLTTSQQRDRLNELFPDLPVLVRPNGYVAADMNSIPERRESAPRDPSVLRIVHFGIFVRLRVDVVKLLTALERSGRWKSIVFDQFGHDHSGALDGLPAGIRVVRHAARPWPEVMRLVGDYDIAIVVGYEVGLMLPSKTIQYLTLPIPRLAVTARPNDDPLMDYVRGRPGWLALEPDDPDAADRVWDHVNREWSPDELRAPEEEAWPAVARQVSDFVARCVGTRAA